jgi:pimeloyl-ACP methyl ester carboxylesterase
MSEQEVLEKSLPIMKLIGTDEAFPDWTPRLQGVVEESVAIDYARGGIDWGGKGGARQSLAINAWTASKLAAHKEGLKKLAVPALVLHGRYDPLIPVESGRDLAGLIPGARLVEYNGGHNLGNDDTVFELIAAAIVEHTALH